jgi:hypothetical protein
MLLTLLFVNIYDNYKTSVIKEIIRKQFPVMYRTTSLVVLNFYNMLEKITNYEENFFSVRCL